jgi:iron complex outermembrane receptor protein
MRLDCRGIVHCALALAGACGAAHGQTVEDDMAAIYGESATISLATGSQKSLRLAPAVASVITAADIAAMGATELEQVLESVPGLHVMRTPLNYEPLYVMRGIYSVQSPQLLVMQNGVPLTSSYTGSKGTVWGGYPLHNVARIEIIRGPGSALYGADAYSGVINIVTRTGADVGGPQAGARAASFQSRDAWLLHGGEVAGASVAAYLRLGTTAGPKNIIEADAQTMRDKAFGTHASLAPGPLNAGFDAADANLDAALASWRLRAAYQLRDNMGTGAGIASALDPVGKSGSARILADLSWTGARDDWTMGASASAMQYKQRVLANFRLSPPGTRFPTGLFPDGMIGHPDVSERQLRLSATAAWSGWAGHSVRAGLGHDDLNVYHTATYKNYVANPAGVPAPMGPVADYSTLSPFMLPQRRRIDYVYLQDEWQYLPDWTLTAGLRHDHYSDVGGTTNPRLALVWVAGYDLTAKLLYGHAFRAPSFNELHGLNNPVQRGNPAIAPETIRTTEAVLIWQATPQLSLRTNLFQFAMNDIIRPVPNPVPGTGATLANAGSQQGEGLESELAWQGTRDLRLAANFSYQRNVDHATGANAGYAPRRHWYARADWRFGDGWLLSPQLNRVAGRVRAAGDNRPPVADYTTADAALNKALGRWDLAIQLRNAFNADAREPSPAPGLIPFDLPLAGRSVAVQATYRF